MLQALIEVRHELDSELRELLDQGRAELELFEAKSRAKVILLEGLDGVGKTTTIDALGERLSAQKLKTPPEELRKWRSFFDDKEETLRRSFYQLGNILLSKKLRESEGGYIVVDRYIPSTFAYEQAHVQARGEQAAAFSWPSHLVKPDVMVMLHLSEELRQTRIQGRLLTLTEEEKKLKQDPRFCGFVIANYMKIESMRQVSIDGKSTEQIVNEICMMLE